MLIFKESQAIARIHRIGQKKSCFVYRIAVEDTIEMEIIKLKNRKDNLINYLYNQGSDPVDSEEMKIFEQDLFELFGKKANTDNCVWELHSGI